MKVGRCEGQGRLEGCWVLIGVLVMMSRKGSTVNAEAVGKSRSCGNYIQFGITTGNEEDEACEEGRAWTAAILRRLNSMLNTVGSHRRITKERILRFVVHGHADGSLEDGFRWARLDGQSFGSGERRRPVSNSLS